MKKLATTAANRGPKSRSMTIGLDLVTAPVTTAFWMRAV